MNKNEATFKYCLRQGDTCLILGQRISEWTGHGPFLEEDLALTNIALDLVGQAQAFLDYAGKVEGKEKSADDLSFHRSERQFINPLLVELTNGDYAKTMVRQFFVDAFQYHLFTALLKSSDVTIAGISAKSIKEATYHLRHSASWLERFGEGTEESHTRTQDAVNELWRYTGDLFDTDESDAIIVKEKIGPDLSEIKKLWMKTIEDVFAKSNLKIPENVFMQSGSKSGKHTENLGFILSEMQYLPRAYPDAKW